jgi:hypothetical protein
MSPTVITELIAIWTYGGRQAAKIASHSTMGIAIIGQTHTIVSQRRPPSQSQSQNQHRCARVKPRLVNIALPSVSSFDGSHRMGVSFARRKASPEDAIAIVVPRGVSSFTKMVHEILLMQTTDTKPRLATSIAGTSHAGLVGILLMADFGTRRQVVVS